MRKGAVLGENVMVGNNCFIDKDVTIGERTRIQNGVSIYSGTTIGKEVFIGPGATLSNCRQPMIRSEEMYPFYPDKIVVENYAIIGINSTLIAPITIGEGSFVGGGSVVTSDVFPYTMVYGNPAKMVYGVCRCQVPIPQGWVAGRIFFAWNNNVYTCPSCDLQYRKLKTGEGVWRDRIIIVPDGRAK